MHYSNYAPEDAQLFGDDLLLVINAFHMVEHGIGRSLTANLEHWNQPYSYSRFLRGIRLAKPHVTANVYPKFLDVGCGLGTKGMLAITQDCQAFGIDINPAYVGIAREMGSTTWVADMFEFQNYDEYDIIYWYQADDVTKRLEALIRSKCRPDAVLFRADNDTLYLPNGETVSVLP